MSSIYVLGHILIESIVFPDGDVLEPVLGSPAAYSSVALACLGNRVVLCTQAGHDVPETFWETFREVGVDLAGAEVSRYGSTRNRLIYETLENKRVEYLHKARPILARDVPACQDPEDVLYVCPMDYEVDPCEVAALASSGRRVVVDLGGYGGATSATHPGGQSAALEHTHAVLAHCTLVKASVEDCTYIYGPVDAESPERAYAERLLEAGSRLVVITLGERGAWVTDGRTSARFQPFPCDVRDTTGAGDTFAAGLLHGWIEKPSNWEYFVQFGQATASYVVQRSGGVSAERMPTRERVLERLRKEGIDV
jgi:sugar/nucleoside kinase (ribokinase family)